MEGVDYARGYIQSWLYQGIGYNADSIPEKSGEDQRPTFAQFPLGQTYITPGIEEAFMIAGQTGIEFLRRRKRLASHS